MSSSSGKIIVVGVGNLILGDEGIGIHLVGELKKRSFPKNVEIHESGTSSFTFLNIAEGASHIIVLDAVRMGKRPGTIHKIDLVLTENSQSPPKLLSLHQLDLIATLEMAKGVWRLPEKITVIGIEPKSFSVGAKLSKPIAEAIPKAISEVMKTLKRIEIEDQATTTSSR